jgi:hypothetical protein
LIRAGLGVEKLYKNGISVSRRIYHKISWVAVRGSRGGKRAIYNEKHSVAGYEVFTVFMGAEGVEPVR